MRAVGGEGAGVWGGSVSGQASPSPPASWVDPAPGLQELVRMFDESVLELHLSLWEDAFTAEQQALAYFFLGEA